MIPSLYKITNRPITREKLTLDLDEKVADFSHKTQSIVDMEALHTELEFLSDFWSDAEVYKLKCVSWMIFSSNQNL